MIVRSAGGRLHLITQPDHAALAGRIMSHWAPLRSEERRASIMLAIAEHDNGWLEEDARPSIDPSTGRVQDFMTAPLHVRQGVWLRAIARLAHDPWAATLVANHAITVYDRYRTDAGWSDFFRDLTQRRDTLLASTARSLDTLLADYSFVRIGDLLSLVFCNRWDTQDYHDWRFALDGDRLAVSPDPFAGLEIPFSIDAREIADVRYPSDADLREALQSAPVIALRGTAIGLAVS